MAALRTLESDTLDRDCAHGKRWAGLRYAELAYYGQWFSTLRQVSLYSSRLASFGMDWYRAMDA